MLEFIFVKYKKVVPLGDFNVHFNTPSNKLLDFKRIDNIFTNINKHDYKVSTLETGSADH